MSRSLADMLSRLLRRQQTTRLGNGRDGVEEIKKHKWFGAFDWAGLLERALVPPYNPSSG